MTQGRLINQNTSARGTTFNLKSSFYADDSFFVFQSRNELYEAVSMLNNHFSWFGPKMHLGSSNSKSKSEAIFFPASLKEAKLQTKLPEVLESISLTSSNIWALSSPPH